MITADDEVAALRLVCADPRQRAYVTSLPSRRGAYVRTESGVFVVNAVAVRLKQRGLVTVDGSIVEPTDTGRAEAAR